MLTAVLTVALFAAEPPKTVQPVPAVTAPKGETIPPPVQAPKAVVVPAAIYSTPVYVRGRFVQPVATVPVGDPVFVAETGAGPFVQGLRFTPVRDVLQRMAERRAARRAILTGGCGG